MLMGSLNQYKVFPAVPVAQSAEGQRGLVKPMVSISLDLPSHRRLIHNHNTPDSRRMLISPLFKVSLPFSKQTNSCNICHRRFNSQTQAEAHYKGNKHARVAKGLVAIRTNRDVPTMRINVTSMGIGTARSTTAAGPRINARAGSTVSTTPPAPGGPVLLSADAEVVHSLLPPEAKMLSCQLCKVDVNSLSQLEAHNRGTKHQAMVDAQNGLGPIKAYPRQPSNPHTQGNTATGFHCRLCNISVNSEVKLKQHICSRKHRDRVAGKIPKPKFTKQQHSVPGQTVLLPLQNEFLMGARFLPNPTTGTVSLASPVASLPPAALPSLLPVPPTVHWFHQLPLGPMRISHGSMLFSPY